MIQGWSSAVHAGLEMANGSAHTHQAVRPWRHGLGASLSQRCGRPVGEGFFAVLPMAPPAFSLSCSSTLSPDGARLLPAWPFRRAESAFTQQGGRAVDHGQPLLQIVREEIVAPAATAEGLQLGGQEHRCGDDPNRAAAWRLLKLGELNSSDVVPPRG
jgi:hypothetical protein